MSSTNSFICPELLPHVGKRIKEECSGLPGLDSKTQSGHERAPCRQSVRAGTKKVVWRVPRCLAVLPSPDP